MSTGLDRLDREFSLLVRIRANWKCARCGGDFSMKQEDLHCSHFHSRRNKSTRFDPQNATALCWECHWYLDHHPTAHKFWKLMQMGQERYDALARRANQIVKPDLKAIREWVRAEMQKGARSVDRAYRLPEISAKLKGIRRT
jgi:hypothetical protein